MAFAITAATVYPLETESSMRNSFVHVAEVTLTATNNDTALNLATLAAADAVHGPYLTTLLDRADKLVSYTFLESPRAAAAAGAAHALSGTAEAPVFTFAGAAATPTALTLCMLVKTKPGYNPVRTPGA